MPVNIRKRARDESAPAKPVVVTPPAVTPTRPVFTKTVHAGKADILPDMDVHDVPGRTKFLVNMHKVENGTAIWYRIMGYDDNNSHMKLRSRHKNTFDAKLHPALALHYLVVMEQEGANEPSQEALNKIRKMVTDPIQNEGV